MNTKSYQDTIYESLKETFREIAVSREWDSIKNDPHLSNHKLVYAPRIDIAVGPFNSYGDLDLGIDNTEIMKEHPFTRRIVRENVIDEQEFNEFWNHDSRCYLAIEIELGNNKSTSNSSKHILGSLINASVTGSIGIVITDCNKRKVERLYNYLLRLRYLGLLQLNTLGNLIIIDKDAFISILLELKNGN